MTPLRGVMISMGYRRAITSKIGTPARTPMTTIAAMSKDELLAVVRSLGLEPTGRETPAALREVIREGSQPGWTPSRRGTARAHHIGGYTRLRKQELVILAAGAGLETAGTVDALKLRLKVWATHSGPVPARMPTARGLLEARGDGFVPAGGPSVRSSSGSARSSTNTASEETYDERPDCPAGHGPMVLRSCRATGKLFWGCPSFSKGVCQVTMHYPGPGQRETSRAEAPEHNSEDEAVDEADDWNSQSESSSGDEALIRELERRRGNRMG